jgi:hypothetical protein
MALRYLQWEFRNNERVDGIHDGQLLWRQSLLGDNRYDDE